MDFLLTSTSLLFIGAGIVIGVFGTLFGASQFVAVPLFQMLLPGVNFGTIIGNFKVGSFFRGIGSTISTYKHIEWRKCLFFAILPILFSIIGVSFIAQIDQKWLFPTIIFAVIMAELAPRFAHKVGKYHFWGASIFSGLYAGFFGAGISIFLTAIFRATHPEDKHISSINIQVRFIELLLVVSSVITHFYHGNLLLKIWLPWSIGSLVGGILGGIMLKKIHHLSGRTQKFILRISFAIAIMVAGIKFFESF